MPESFPRRFWLKSLLLGSTFLLMPNRQPTAQSQLLPVLKKVGELVIAAGEMAGAVKAVVELVGKATDTIICTYNKFALRHLIENFRELARLSEIRSAQEDSLVTQITLFLGERTPERWRNVSILSDDFSAETYDLQRTVQNLGGEFVKTDAYQKLRIAASISAGQIAYMSEMPLPQTSEEFSEVERIMIILKETHGNFADAIPEVEKFQTDLQSKACGEIPRGS